MCPQIRISQESVAATTDENPCDICVISHVTYLSLMSFTKQQDQTPISKFLLVSLPHAVGDLLKTHTTRGHNINLLCQRRLLVTITLTKILQLRIHKAVYNRCVIVANFLTVRAGRVAACFDSCTA